MLYGTHNQRVKPRLEVLRGFDPTQPNTLTHTAPVHTGVTIKSGQAIVLVADDDHPSEPGRDSWTLADSDTVAHRTMDIYIALQDSDDEDILGADGLTGYNTAGEFEFESGYFDAGTYNTGATFLTISATAGNITTTTIGSGMPIVGKISRSSPKDISPVNSNVPAGTTVITWRTGLVPNPA